MRYKIGYIAQWIEKAIARSDKLSNQYSIQLRYATLFYMFSLFCYKLQICHFSHSAMGVGKPILWYSFYSSRRAESIGVSRLKKFTLGDFFSFLTTVGDGQKIVISIKHFIPHQEPFQKVLPDVLWFQELEEVILVPKIYVALKISLTNPWHNFRFR
jgi:hypothetical protein